MKKASKGSGTHSKKNSNLFVEPCNSVSINYLAYITAIAHYSLHLLLIILLDIAIMLRKKNSYVHRGSDS